MTTLKVVTKKVPKHTTIDSSLRVVKMNDNAEGHAKGT